jgi:hypothetical protein
MVFIETVVMVQKRKDGEIISTNEWENLRM